MQHSEITFSPRSLHFPLAKEPSKLLGSQDVRWLFVYTWSLQVFNRISNDHTGTAHIAEKRFQSRQFACYRRWTIGLAVAHFQQISRYMFARDLLPALYFLLSEIEAGLVQIIAIGHYRIFIGTISPLFSQGERGNILLNDVF